LLFTTACITADFLEKLKKSVGNHTKPISREKEKEVMSRHKTHEHHSGRNILSRRRTTVRTVSLNAKAKHRAGYESKLQYQWSLWFDWDDSVIVYQEEIAPIEIPTAYGMISYSADFGIERDDGTSQLVEIKPQEQLRQPQVIDRLRIIKSGLAKQGIPLCILSESELPANRFGISILRRLKHIRNDCTVDPNELHQHMPAERTTYGELSKSQSDITILRLMAHKLLCFDINNRLTIDTVLTPAKEVTHD
jgi:hypothetical protein